MHRTLVRRIRAGWLYSDIAKELGVSKNACVGRANRAGIKCPDKSANLSKAMLGKNTKFDHQSARKMRARGASLRDISAHFGVSLFWAGRVCRGVACPVNHIAAAWARKRAA